MFIKDGELLTLHSNPFRFLYLTAKRCICKAEQSKLKSDKESECNYSMAAIILLLLSSEALINRIYEKFIKSKLPKTIYREIVDRWSPIVKWYFAPLLFDHKRGRTFEVDREPWQSFSELKKIRDYFAHPKPLRYPLTVLNAREKAVDFAQEVPRWAQTKIPKDLHHFRVSDAKKTLEIINQMIDQLDSFMGGIVKKDDWYLQEELKKENQ